MTYLRQLFARLKRTKAPAEDTFGNRLTRIGTRESRRTACRAILFRS